MEADRLADSIQTSAGDLIAELQAVRDSVEELYILLDHIWRNREELHDILAGLREENAGRDMGLTREQMDQAKAEGVTTEIGLRRIEKNTRADEIPETIACARCDVDSPPSIAAALQEGWIDLCRDDGPGWNYLGVCPECQSRENAAANQDATQTDDQKRLFA